MDIYDRIGWISIVIALIALVMCLGGCSGSEQDLADAIGAFAKACDGNLTGEFSAGSYNKVLTLKCDRMTFKELKK